jgi:hypothetical protein
MIIGDVIRWSSASTGNRADVSKVALIVRRDSRPCLPASPSAAQSRTASAATAGPDTVVTFTRSGFQDARFIVTNTWKLACIFD